jgi:hypothetical protein
LWKNKIKHITGKGEKRIEEIQKAWEDFKKEKKFANLSMTNREFEQGLAQIVYCDNGNNKNHPLEPKDVVVFAGQKNPRYAEERVKYANEIKSAYGW